jgi:hypothetical protein
MQHKFIRRNIIGILRIVRLSAWLGLRPHMVQQDSGNTRGLGLRTGALCHQHFCGQQSGRCTRDLRLRTVRRRVRRSSFNLLLFLLIILLLSGWSFCFGFVLYIYRKSKSEMNVAKGCARSLRWHHRLRYLPVLPALLFLICGENLAALLTIASIYLPNQRQY